MTVGGNDAEGRQGSHGDVPGGESAVYRPFEVARASHPRKTGRRVDGVVDLARSVRVTGERDHDEVLPSFAQPPVVKPVARREICEEDPGVGYQRDDQFAARIRA